MSQYDSFFCQLKYLLHVTENSIPNIKGSPESPTFIIEFYVKASGSDLESASRRTLGDDTVWEQEKFGFSATIVIEDCPLQLLFYRVEEDTYYVLSDSTCNIDDCPNISRCLDQDARIFDNVYICQKCNAKNRVDRRRIRLNKAKCRECGYTRLRAKRREH